MTAAERAPGTAWLERRARCRWTQPWSQAELSRKNAAMQGRRWAWEAGRYENPAEGSGERSRFPCARRGVGLERVRRHARIHATPGRVDFHIFDLLPADRHFHH